MINMVGLTFDWDDVSITDTKVQDALNDLDKDFPSKVWYRISSSGTGLHVIIGELSYDTLFGMVFNPVEIKPDTQFTYRKKFSDEPWSLECEGRIILTKFNAEGFEPAVFSKSKNDNLHNGFTGLVS